MIRLGLFTNINNEDISIIIGTQGDSAIGNGDAAYDELAACDFDWDTWVENMLSEYGVTAKEMIMAEDSVIIKTERQDSENVFSPIVTSSATIKIVQTDLETDFFVGDYSCDVAIKNETTGQSLFYGFLVPLTFNQDFKYVNDELQLEAVSYLTTLENKKIDIYSAICGNTNPEVTLYQLIWQALTGNPIYYGFYTNFYLYKDGSRVTFHDLYINRYNFVSDDEEKKPWTWREVIEEICRTFNLVLLEYNTKIYMVDLIRFNCDKGSYNESDTTISVDMKFYTFSDDSILPIPHTSNIITTSNTTLGEDGVNISLNDIYNKINIVYNNMFIDSQTNLDDIPTTIQNDTTGYTNNYWVDILNDYYQHWSTYNYIALSDLETKTAFNWHTEPNLSWKKISIFSDSDTANGRWHFNDSTSCAEYIRCGINSQDNLLEISIGDQRENPYFCENQQHLWVQFLTPATDDLILYNYKPDKLATIFTNYPYEVQGYNLIPNKIQESVSNYDLRILYYDNYALSRILYNDLMYCSTEEYAENCYDKLPYNNISCTLVNMSDGNSTNLKRKLYIKATEILGDLTRPDSTVIAPVIPDRAYCDYSEDRPFSVYPYDYNGNKVDKEQDFVCVPVVTQPIQKMCTFKIKNMTPSTNNKFLSMNLGLLYNLSWEEHRGLALCCDIPFKSSNVAHPSGDNKVEGKKKSTCNVHNFINLQIKCGDWYCTAGNIDEEYTYTDTNGVEQTVKPMYKVFHPSVSDTNYDFTDDKKHDYGFIADNIANYAWIYLPDDKIYITQGGFYKSMLDFYKEKYSPGWLSEPHFRWYFDPEFNVRQNVTFYKYENEDYKELDADGQIIELPPIVQEGEYTYTDLNGNEQPVPAFNIEDIEISIYRPHTPLREVKYDIEYITPTAFINKSLFLHGVLIDKADFRIIEYKNAFYSDDDVLITNTDNESFINEMDDIELKIGSQYGDRYNTLSALKIYNSDTGHYDNFINNLNDGIYQNGENINSDYVEDLLLNRYYKQYNNKRLILNGVYNGKLDILDVIKENNINSSQDENHVAEFITLDAEYDVNNNVTSITSSEIYKQ